MKLLYALRTNRYPPKSGDLSTMKTFLASLGLDRYCKAFEEAEVDMGAVDVMEEADYAQLGVAKVGGSSSVGVVVSHPGRVCCVPSRGACVSIQRRCLSAATAFLFSRRACVERFMCVPCNDGVCAMTARCSKSYTVSPYP